MRRSLSSVLFFCVASLLLLSVSFAADIEVDDPDVVVLTTENFETFINQDLALVEFYAPWCGHCKSLAPEYAKAGTTLAANNPPIPIGKCDATVYGELSSKFGVSGYPTLKVFRNGKASDYNGPRQADGIVSYMKKQVGPAIKPVNTENDLNALVNSEPTVAHAVIGFFDSEKQSQLQSAFNLIGNKLRDDYVMGKTTNAELKAKYNIKGEALVAFLKNDVTVYEGDTKTSSVENFIKSSAIPLVGEYSEKTANMYTQRGLPVAKLFLKVDRTPKSKTMVYYINRLKKIAQQFQNKIAVTYADRDGQKQTLEHFNLQNEEHGFVIEDSRGNKQYKFEADEDDDKKKKGLDTEGWTNFIESVLSGSARTYLKSEREPKKNNGPVKIATGNNFQDLVMDDDKDVLIEFYAPWCGHCKSLEPKYKELGQKMKKYEDVVIAKLDATANDFPRDTFKVSGYPTIFFKPAGKSPRLYEGDREVEDFVEYLKENATTLKKKKKKAKKAKKSKKSKKE